ncbi:hypothetical protein QY895_08620 [Latilactobacillus sakei]
MTNQWVNEVRQKWLRNQCQLANLAEPLKPKRKKNRKRDQKNKGYHKKNKDLTV